jgi:hypothetical protein
MRDVDDSLLVMGLFDFLFVTNTGLGGMEFVEYGFLAIPS